MNVYFLMMTSLLIVPFGKIKAQAFIKTSYFHNVEYENGVSGDEGTYKEGEIRNFFDNREKYTLSPSLYLSLGIK